MRAEVTFDVMGSTAHVVIVGGTPVLLETARERLEDLEARWSRFVATSEVSTLNRADGRPVLVSHDTRLLVRRAARRALAHRRSLRPDRARGCVACGVRGDLRGRSRPA